MSAKEDTENKPKCSKPLNLSLKKSKKKRLQCKSGDETKQLSRFASPYGEHKLDKLAEGLKPVNTEVSTQWAINDF